MRICAHPLSADSISVQSFTFGTRSGRGTQAAFGDLREGFYFGGRGREGPDEVGTFGPAKAAAD